MINELKAKGIKVSQSCNMLSISRSTYYRLCSKKEVNPLKLKATKRRNEDEEYIALIKQIKTEHQFWGYRRVQAYMKYRLGIGIGKKRVYRLMKQNGLLVNVKRYKAKRTPQKSKPRPEKLNQWWGIDMTKFYINGVGWAYLVIVLEWYSKKVLGYKLSLRSRADEWIEALNMAVDNNLSFGARSYSLNLMSDNGSQPTSVKFEKALALLKINHVTTSYSNPKGNADTERFMRTFKEELIYINEFDSFSEAEVKVDNFIKFYNEHYPHSALGYLTPVEFENLSVNKNVA